MHWCLGMRSSGSTWVFNVVRKIAAVLVPNRPVVGPYIVRGDELPAFDDCSRFLVVKSHETDDAAAAELGSHAQAIWLSIRDPRDCVASLVRYHDMDFDTALQQVRRDANFCQRFIAHPQARILRYEEGFADNPATLDRIAAGFGSVLTAADRDRIFAQMRRPVIEAFIQQLEQLPTALRPAPNDLVDPATKWHRHHANRTGEIGRWRRELTGSQAVAVRQDLVNWMNSLGYQSR